MKRKYIVRVNDVPALYAPRYFPREFAYKREAIEVAKIAIKNGATLARVECPDGAELDFRPEKESKP